MRAMGGVGLSGAAAVAPRRPLPKKRWLPVSALEFVGCEKCRMTLAEYEGLPDEKVEFFDSAAGLAWTVRESPGFDHEAPGSTLVALLDRIAMMRGSPLKCQGSASLRLLDAESRQVRAMHPDQMVYLDPNQLERVGPGFLRVGEQEYPDVVLEVDHTTDVRRNKLRLYEEWGFPELWVEVPSAYSPSRPRGLRPGLRIYLRREGRYRESEESGAFPGWRAEEIHRALNELVISPETTEVLARVGRALGEREGTGPDDDPLLGSIGRQRRAEGIAEGMAAGRAAGVSEGRVEVARALLRQRGVEVSGRFPADLPAQDRVALRRASAEAVVEAASGAASQADFLARLR